MELINKMLLIVAAINLRKPITPLLKPFFAVYAFYKKQLIHNCIYSGFGLSLYHVKKERERRKLSTAPKLVFPTKSYLNIISMPKKSIAKNISYEITQLGKYLNRLREEQDLSIRHVAKKCGISPSYLSKIEAGDTFKTIGLETLVKLSKFYGIPVSAMLKEAGLIESHEDDLPELAQYLRAKYQLSPQAIRDMAMAKEIVDKKYERENIRRSK